MITIISRPRTQQVIAATSTYFLESRGQASSAGLKHTDSGAWQPLTNWAAEDRNHQHAGNTSWDGSHSQTEQQRTVIINRHEIQQGTVATHSLKSRGQGSLQGLKYRKAQKPLTNWRAGTSIISNLKCRKEQ